MAAKADQVILQALQQFGTAVTDKLKGLAAGEPEDQLRAPLENFLTAFGKAIGRTIVSKGESLLEGRIGRPVTVAWLVLLVVSCAPQMKPSLRSDKAVQTFEIIHIGDLHGHLVPRPNVRDTGTGQGMKGGLARIYAVIRDLRKNDGGMLLINTGDTVQGSAETLYTQGQAIVNVLNRFDIDAYAPGNWDYLYGTQRFLKLFSGAGAAAPWNGLAANLYYSTLTEDPTTPYPDRGGQRVLPPYKIRQVNGVKVGILGFTNSRGPTVVGASTMKGFKLTEGDTEVPEFVKILRNVEHVDVLVMISELGLGNNIRLAGANPGIDFVLSSDMHEETREPVVLANGTVLVEEGQDGTVMGHLKIEVQDHRVKSYTWRMIDVDESIREDPAIASAVSAERKRFVTGPDFVALENPLNHSHLKRPVDTVVGYTTVPLHRGNFSNQPMPAVIEGSSHDFLTDAFRAMTGADLGATRGFRYGTHVRAGPITLEDLYHFLAIGRQIAVGTITGGAIKDQIEKSAAGCLDPNVAHWTGGWVYNFSNLTFDLDPYQVDGKRLSTIMIGGKPLMETANYRYASYWYPEDPNLVNVTPASDIKVLTDNDGGPLDVTEVVVRYLESLPDRTVSPVLNRIHLVRPLPPPAYGNPEIQPLRGAQ